MKRVFTNLTAGLVLQTVKDSCKDGECDCKPGFWGPDCDNSCDPHCVNVNTGGYHKKDGFCDSCTDGWWGHQCDKPCSSHCKERKCDKTKGTCLCVPGYKPDNCRNGTFLISISVNIFNFPL